MALVSPPSWLQAGTYTAQSDRQNQQAIFGSTGVIGAASLAVTAQASPNMTVNIASGWGAIVSSTSNAGVYGVFNDATVIQTISTADATNPRIDLIVATINDAQYSGTLNSVVFTTVAGTPAASPVAPAVPSNSLVLAQIAVAANTTTITSANITDRRVPVQNALTNANYFASTSPYTVATPTTAAQNIYASAGSALALAANTTYEVEGELRVSIVNGATAIGPSWQLTYSGTALTSLIRFTSTYNTAGFSNSTATGSATGSAAVGAVVGGAGASINLTNYHTLYFKGIVRTTTAGNLTPQMTLSSVTAIGAVISQANSSFKVTPVGGSTLLSVGAWS